MTSGLTDYGRDDNVFGAVTPTLVDWFHHHRRSLPWDDTRDSYKIWVAEVMLQQTVWSVVPPFWERWMAKFPDVVKLAQAGRSEVLRAWEGLGYYRRAVHLHQAAQQILNQSYGILPETYERWLELPGVGPYISAAIMSLAFDAPYPPLDANLIRIGRRLLGVKNITKEARNTVRSYFTRWYQSYSPRMLTLALMALGQLVCLPKAPQCSRCPLSQLCSYFQEPFSEPALLRPAKISRTVQALIPVRDNAVYLTQSKSGRFAHMWQLVLRHSDEEGGTPCSPSAAGSRRTFMALPTVCHHYTKYVVKMKGWLLIGNDNDLSDEAGQWVGWEEAEKLPMPSAHRKLLRAAHTLWMKARGNKRGETIKLEES